MSMTAPEALMKPANRRDWREAKPGTKRRERIEKRKRNWEGCREEFWREEWRPAFDYSHTTDQVVAMWGEVTEEEKDRVVKAYRELGADVIAAADTARIPWSVTRRILKVHDEESAQMLAHKVRMGERTSLTALDRWKMVEEKLLMEVERRVRTGYARKKMLPAELQQMLKTAATVIRFKEDAKGAGNDMTMQVITQLPMLEERGEAGLEEE